MKPRSCFSLVLFLFIGFSTCYAADMSLLTKIEGEYIGGIAHSISPKKAARLKVELKEGYVVISWSLNSKKEIQETFSTFPLDDPTGWLTEIVFTKFEENEYDFLDEGIVTFNTVWNYWLTLENDRLVKACIQKYNTNDKKNPLYYIELAGLIKQF